MALRRLHARAAFASSFAMLDFEDVFPVFFMIAR
jgi:hypothetical protein